jgi:hypothetical protein
VDRFVCSVFIKTEVWIFITSSSARYVGLHLLSR